MKKNLLDAFLEKLFDFPLWVKQIIYMRLGKHLALNLSDDFMSIPESKLFHLYIPTFTFNGRNELIERTAGYDSNVYTFLSDVDKGLTMLDISMNNFWTMEETAALYVKCLDEALLKPAESNYILAMAEFMAGKLRIGEYFKHINKIDVNQLEKIIFTQKEYAAKNQPKKMAEIMIELGYITKQDVHSLLIIKEESKLRFILDSSVIPEAVKEKGASNFGQSQIDKLVEENTQLKEQLKRILSFVKKNV